MKILALALFLLAPAAQAGPFEKLAASLTKDLGSHKDKKAAVVPFSYADGRSSEGGTVVAAALETALVGRGLVLVDRAHLDKVLQELNLQRAGLVPEKSALQVGKMSGADFLITGTLSDSSKGSVDCNARLIAVGTGEVLKAAKARLEKTWTDGPPLRLPGAGAAPQPAGVRFSLVSAIAGAERRIGDRSLAFRYGDQGKRPILIVSDYTDPKKPLTAELPFEYDAANHRYAPEWKRDFKLAGRVYRIWTDLYQKFHVAPLAGSLLIPGKPVQEQETAFPVNAVFEAWIEDINKRSAVLEEYKPPYDVPVKRVLGYFEPLKDLELRISLYRIKNRGGEDELDYSPLDVAVLKGKRGKTVISRLVGSGAPLFRFHYSADSQEVLAEQVQ